MILITLCMIVKNEQASLGTCLDMIADQMDEIIIVDTGSADRTKEIAAKYTDKVYDYVWTNDFSEARNYSISKASNDYILIIDADEIMQDIDVSQIKKLIQENPTKIGRLLRINEFIRNGNPYRFYERVNRLFSRKHYNYDGMIHEQIKPINNNDSTSIQSEQDQSYLIPLTIIHSGYEGGVTVRKKKTERNIKLLNVAHAKNPNDPYILYQLGKSYYMEENYVSACDYFGQALYFDLDPYLEYVQDLVESYGYALINSGQYETAMQLQGLYEEFSHSADFEFMMALVFMNNGKFQLAIDEFVKTTNKKDCKMEGVNSYLAFYNIAVIYECMGNKQLALEYYRKCKNYEPALSRLILISKD